MKCLECDTVMSDGIDECNSCGWTYKRQEGDDFSEAQPVCVKCFTPIPSLAHYCLSCGETVGQYTAYIPFVDIQFQARFFHSVWRTAWHGEGVSAIKRLFYVFLCCLLSPIFIIAIFVELFKKEFCKETKVK